MWRNACQWASPYRGLVMHSLLPSLCPSKISLPNSRLASEMYYRADPRFAPSQWETALQSKAISHWLGTNLESALYYDTLDQNAMYTWMKWMSMQWTCVCNGRGYGSSIKIYSMTCWCQWAIKHGWAITAATTTTTTTRSLNTQLPAPTGLSALIG